MKKVLIVEDDRIILLLNKKYVSELGHEVVGTVWTGNQAIEVAKEKKPDLILMDVRIEGEMDGIETAKRIGEFSDAQIIYFSGSSDASTVERAQQTNMIAFLVKPVSLEMLKEVIEKK